MLIYIHMPYIPCLPTAHTRFFLPTVYIHTCHLSFIVPVLHGFILSLVLIFTKYLNLIIPYLFIWSYMFTISDVFAC